MANRLIGASGLAFALLVPANGWTEGLLQVAPRPGSEAGGLNVSHPALPGNIFDLRTCEAVLGGQPLRLDRTEHGRRQVHLSLLPKGGTSIEWAWWVNSTNTFDEPLFAVASHDNQWTAGLWFERAAWASSNTGDNRACFHLFPLLGRIEPGASATVRGAFFYLRGSPETLRRCAHPRVEPGQQGSSA
jgi:hypothetical protein